jgi:RNA polymerase sigma-70 factor (ECF subfamily)
MLSLPSHDDAGRTPHPSAPEWSGGWPQSIAEFEALVETFQVQLVAYAFRRLRDHADAEDVVQEVFIRAWSERDRLCGVHLVRPYLFRMTANACLDHLRRRGRRKIVSIDEVGAINLADQRPSADRYHGALEELERIDRLLSKLPERQAEVIRLHLYDELSMAEVASVLDCPPATARSRLRNGLEKLRKFVNRGKEAWR